MTPPATSVLPAPALSAELLAPVSRRFGLGIGGIRPIARPTSIDAQQVLLEHALALVAEAEQKLSVQRERIAHLETLIMTDELTGLLNRRGFFSHFRRELAAARRVASAHGLLVLCDLDGFKGVNDTYGHTAGDAYLRQVARTLSEAVRPEDVVARLGGDEFAILLTRTEADNGIARAAQIAATLNAATATWQGKELPIRASFGTQRYASSDCEDVVVRRADVNLYANKAKGRAPRSRRG